MDALTEVWEHHGEAVRRFARHLSGDASLADDLTQEAFVRLWTTTSPIRTETVRAYLFTIVRNLHRRAHRRGRRMEPIRDDVVDETARPDERAAEREEGRRLARALADLDEDDRTALLMRVDGEVSYDDIGLALGISAGAARVRVHRARRRLSLATRQTGGRT
jgi:RNA polymerase sigma-70 factor (ECF subfamily)